ncbi:MAG: isoprenylcysteine carboxylmethyltransferase family protein [Gammaproteobacteria bacterium]|nr:isoprenylcysteine carboxylmethyltransferase family protein [Gammaproteobacteria bacterium]
MKRFNVIVRSVASLGLFAAVLFWPAGTIGWAAGWAYLAVLIASSAAMMAYVYRVSPDLIEHRMRVGSGTKGWDKVVLSVFGLTYLAILVVAGFDAVRYEWSTMSPWLWFAGLAIFLPGAVLVTWAMGVNPFFEKTVRIQSERGHRVIDSGPYAFVRHPGYVGLFGWTLSVPLFLGSMWAFLPALLSVATMVIRTALEDRTLRAELEGYEEYAGKVPFRLIPGVW